MLGLSFISLNSDYLKFIQRLLSFYSFNFKMLYNSQGDNYLSSATLLDSKLEAKARLDKLVS